MSFLLSKTFWNAAMAVFLPSYCLQGLRAIPVRIEVDVSPGMPNFSIIGMAGVSVQESKDRVRSALIQSGFQFPLTRKVVNLAPAELSKQGSHFDLPIALGLLVASGQLDLKARDFKNILVVGELSLEGEVQPVHGLLPALCTFQGKGLSKVILPQANWVEAKLVQGFELLPVKHLSEAVDILLGKKKVQFFSGEKKNDENFESIAETADRFILDYQDISGHKATKRALLVAAAGGHHVRMTGPPGSGKSLLAEAFAGILPPLSPEEALEVMQIYSVAGHGDWKAGHLRQRPFRHVNPRITPYGLVGGGLDLQPGELSLAHRGVLFMDEFPEFERTTLEVLRQPLEARSILLKHGKRSSVYPCEFQLIAAQNPCPCGYLGDNEKLCSCAAASISRYKNKISGPLLDRIDLHIEVPRLPYQDFKLNGFESSAQFREKVTEARERQRARLKEAGLFTNSQMTPKLLNAEQLDFKTEEVLETVARHHALSGRAIHRIIKVARTIADLEGKDFILLSHLMEALQYRLKT